MVETTLPNDGSPKPDGGGRDGHGEAALGLVESLLHGLVQHSVITVGDAVEVVEIALDAQSEIDADREGAFGHRQDPVTLLQAISASLHHDLVDDDSGPGR